MDGCTIDNSVNPGIASVAEVDTSTSLLRSVSPAAPQTSVFQSLTTQLELYMKSTDSALINSQTALEQWMEKVEEVKERQIQK
ncbi:hypothetical protein K457DRAFT_16894 [Linnemannia elongata AG-77]|uniref:Uncharacterized protein n=1 Tax=Linnemannia elongata AG-77 TaxID=1314771 RepID=A0A197K498_9FUNG|nr:hypothetical protein K457DRAFT_16894 [Linnemannia elongata AG-77]